MTPPAATTAATAVVAATFAAAAGEERLEAKEQGPEVEPEGGATTHRQRTRERPSSTRQKRVRRGGAHSQLRGDLLGGEPAQLPHDEGSALPLGQRRERVVEPGQKLLVAGIALTGGERVEIETGHRAAPGRRPPLHSADVLGDRVQPRELVLGNDASLQRAVRMEEGRLDRVLGVATVAKRMDAVRQDAPGVALVEEAGFGGRVLWIRSLDVPQVDRHRRPPSHNVHKM